MDTAEQDTYEWNFMDDSSVILADGSTKRRGTEGIGFENRRRCEVCKKKLLRTSMVSHLRKIHNYSEGQLKPIKETLKSKSRVCCPACGGRFVDIEDLANHCQRRHRHNGANGTSQDYTIQRQIFDSEETFREWFERKCEASNTTLVKKGHSGNSGTSRGKICYFRCHRAGRSDFGRCKSSKKRDSRYDCQHCTCFVNVRMCEDGAIEVKACFGHVGHDIEVRLLSLTKEQKEFLKSLLEEYPMDHIIDSLKKELPNESRLHNVTRVDLWSILEEYQMRPVMSCSSGLVSMGFGEAGRLRDLIQSKELRCDSITEVAHLPKSPVSTKDAMQPNEKSREGGVVMIQEKEESTICESGAVESNERLFNGFFDHIVIDEGSDVKRGPSPRVKDCDEDETDSILMMWHGNTPVSSKVTSGGRAMDSDWIEDFRSRLEAIQSVVLANVDQLIKSGSEDAKEKLRQIEETTIQLLKISSDEECPLNTLQPQTNDAETKDPLEHA